MTKYIIQKLGTIALPFLLAALAVSASAQTAATADGDGSREAAAEEGVRMVDVAYGRQSYDAVTASIGTIYSDKITQGISTSLGQALQGKLPGVTVIQNSFEPGSAATIYLRGTNTYNTGNTPLVLVDGFRADFNRLTVYEIESISVLKDAAAVVLYGQEAAGDVILITTKRGRKGPTRISVDAEYGMQAFADLPDMLSSLEYATYYNQALSNDGLPAKFTDIYDTAGNPYYGQDSIYRYTHPDNNFLKELTRAWAPVARAGVTIDGGGDAVQYMVTAGYLHNGGLLNRTKENSYSTQTFTHRYNLRSNLDIRISRNLSAQVDMGGSIETRNRPGRDIQSLFDHIYWTPPTEYPLVNPDGSLGGNANYTTNPYGSIAQKGYMTNLYRTLDIRLGLRYDLGDFVKGLSVGAKGAFYNYQVQNDNKTRYFAVWEIDTVPADGSLAGITYTQYDQDSDLTADSVSELASQERKNFEADVSFSCSFGPHAVNTMLMFHMDRYETSANYHYKFSNAGLGFRAHYGYDDRYFAEYAASYYGQEQYAKGHRFGFFQAGAVAWVASREEFLRGSRVVDYLKVRASYGKVGGQAFKGNTVSERLYHTQWYYTLGTTTLGESGNNGASGRFRGPYANKYVTWDKSYKTDVSVEATLLGHINLMLDYYHDVRRDILTTVSYDYPGTMGLNNGYFLRSSSDSGLGYDELLASYGGLANTGKVRNQGFEATLGYFGAAGDLSYSVDAGVWFNRNKILRDPSAAEYEWDHANTVGRRVGQYFGYVADGFYTAEDIASGRVYQSFGKVREGDVKYRDLNYDGVIDEKDQVAVGYSPVPEYTYNLCIDLRYRNFSLTLLGQGTANGSVMLTDNHIPLYNRGNAIRQITEKSWTPETAATARYPRLSTLGNANNSQPSTIWILSTDYFKVRNIELGYDLPESVLRRINFGTFRIYLSAQNMFTFAKEIDFTDPESLMDPSDYRMKYPATKSVSLGVKLSF